MKTIHRSTVPAPAPTTRFERTKCGRTIDSKTDRKHQVIRADDGVTCDKCLDAGKPVRKGL